MAEYSSLITHNPSLVTLERRLRLRWLLDRSRIGLLWGLLGGAVLLLGGRLLGETAWEAVAAAWAVACLVAAILAGRKRWPDDWATACAADDLGLQERVASALYAARSNHPLAPLLEQEAEAALVRLVPSDYPIVPRPRRWGWVFSAGLLAVAMSLAPIPTLGNGGQRAAEARSVAESREAVKKLQAALPASPTPVPLAQTAAAELQALHEQLARAQGAEEAARALDEHQERLAGLAQREDYAWQRALEGLATTWGQDPQLGALARSMESRDAQAVERALAELESRVVGQMSPDEQRELRQSLQAGANAARDVPPLAAALRQAAQQVGSTQSGSGNSSSGLGELSRMMSQGAARSAALQSVQQALAGLSRARAALGPASGSSTRAASAGGSATAAGGSASQGGGSGASSGAGASASGSGTEGATGGSGQGSGSGAGTGSGSGSGGGSGTGSGAGSAGAGGAGSGSGAGAGAGGGPAQGRPSSGNSGATTTGGSVAPSMRGSTNYERIYAPSLLGGEGGPRVQSPGDAAGASGEVVDLPNSPLELGELRPYDQVYGRYEAEARQSASRQSLPPALQGLVQRYYSAIDPGNE